MTGQSPGYPSSKPGLSKPDLALPGNFAGDSGRVIRLQENG
jgi:hypothetical protein